MRTSRQFINFSKLVLVVVFLVILAGGVVRMTQSGMGCPDWPTCFGRWIPPTDVSELPANYKELYAFKYVDTSFNAYHTWIEYVNRLLGAILGVLLLIQLIWSWKFRKINRRVFWLSTGNFLLTGFQGWLGSKVVEENLEVAKVTTHMLVALAIAALAYHIIYEASKKSVRIINGRLKWLSLLAIVLLLVQIVLGTQVREQIDHISLKLNFQSREKWIEQLDIIFYIHRSFSLIVAACCFYLYFKYKDIAALSSTIMLAVLLVLLIIALGVIMNYLNVPAVAQPLHLVLSSILVVVLYSIYLKSSFRANQNVLL